MMNRPEKGFGVPVAGWMKEDFSHLTMGLLDKEYIAKQGILDANTVNRMTIKFRNSTNIKTIEAYGRELWSLLVFQLWWERWMD